MATATNPKSNSEPKQAPSVDIVRSSLYNNVEPIQKLLIDKINEKCNLVKDILNQQDNDSRKILIRSLPTHQMVLEELVDKLAELDRLVIRLEKAEKIALESV